MSSALAVPAHDVIQDVCGVPAAEILRRCGRIRALRATGGRLPQAPDTAMLLAARTWRLMDFAEGSRESFIEAAHWAVLRRAPLPHEMERRLAQLRRGRTRLELLLRLVVSPEAARVKEPAVAGYVLPGLLRLRNGLGIVLRRSR